MIFKRERQQGKSFSFEEGKGSLEVKRDSEIIKQVKMIDLHKRDLEIINAIQPFVTEQIEDIVARFGLLSRKWTLICLELAYFFPSALRVPLRLHAST
ncbi:hypothetical protein [Sutcliffiella horikoshii]|uniref:hypothetical protein n=1 Tax=Sutcliffiella horikoshii TaxID=79883 RepID=UPI003CF6B28F